MHKISYSHAFLEKDHLLFSVQRNIFRQKNKFFPDNTRQVMFQCKFFGKTVFLEHLEKWNMAFHSEVKAFLWYICLKLPVYIRSKLREEVPFTLIFIWYNSEPLGFFVFFLTLRPRGMRRAWKQWRASASSPSPLFALLLSFVLFFFWSRWRMRIWRKRYATSFPCLLFLVVFSSFFD